MPTNTRAHDLSESLMTVLLTGVGFIVGLDCAINGWYFLSHLSMSVYALPVISGFLLNYILYRKDVDSIKNFFIPSNQSSDSFSPRKVAVNAIALVNGVVMFLFTYQSYAALMNNAPFSYLPAFVPFLFCASYGIGTIALLYNDCQHIVDNLVPQDGSNFSLSALILPNRFRFNTLESSHICYIAIAFINTICITCFSYYPVVYQIYAVCPFAVRFICDMMFSTFLLTELRYSIDMMLKPHDTTLKDISSKPMLTILTLSNAFANAYLTLGGLRFGNVLNSLISCSGFAVSAATMQYNCKDVFEDEDNQPKQLSQILGLDELTHHCQNIYTTAVGKFS